MNTISSTHTESGFTALSDLTVGSSVRIYGVLHNVRIKKWGGFLIVRKPEGLIQGIVSNDSTVITDENGQTITANDLTREMSIILEGKVNEANIKDPAMLNNTVEIDVQSINVLSRPATTEVFDIAQLDRLEPEAQITVKLDNRQVSLRNPKDMAILRVQAAICTAFAEYLTSVGFTQIHSPKIVSEGAEGGANVFKFPYFDKEVYLAQSPQFYKQIGVGVFERVFEIAPCYRAENSNTSRHLCEFISMDVEMGFIKSQEDVMELEMQLLRHIIKYVDEHCQHELKLLSATLPLLPDSIPSFRLSEAHEVLFENHLCQDDHRGEDDMAPEEERAICEYTKEKYESDFAFVTHFPSKHRAFYAMDSKDDPTLTESFDLLMRGLEITSGGQRMHEEADYRRKMLERGMNPDNFKFYMDTFRNGMPPHGGFAIGLERLTACLLKLDNVKLASMFPRDVNRVTP